MDKSGCIHSLYTFLLWMPAYIASPDKRAAASPDIPATHQNTETDSAISAEISQNGSLYCCFSIVFSPTGKTVSYSLRRENRPVLSTNRKFLLTFPAVSIEFLKFCMATPSIALGKTTS